MEQSIYNQIGGFVFVRKLIADFYSKVLENDKLAVLFERTNMERLIDHQTKFFAMILGGPVSYTDEEIKLAHQRLGISNIQFDMTKECLVETLEDFDLSEDHISYISNAFESKRKIIVHSN